LNLTDRIKDLNKIIIDLQICLKTYLIDQTKDINERWECYKLACDNNIANEEDNWGPSLNTLEALGIDSSYDYLYIERHQSQDYTVMIENLEERLEYPRETTGIWKNIDLTQEAINKIKEEILTRFPERGFRHDW
jgi:hypothetical protein